MDTWKVRKTWAIWTAPFLPKLDSSERYGCLSVLWTRKLRLWKCLFLKVMPAECSRVQFLCHCPSQHTVQPLKIAVLYFGEVVPAQNTPLTLLTLLLSTVFEFLLGLHSSSLESMFFGLFHQPALRPTWRKKMLLLMYNLKNVKFVALMFCNED